MAAFKPYKFIILDKFLKNSNFHTQIISYLELSLLCKEIYISENFSKLNYESICRNKLIYYSDESLIYKLKQNKIIDDKVQQNSSNKNNKFINGNSNYNLGENENNIRREQLEVKESNKKKDIEKENSISSNKYDNIRNKNDLVSFFIYDNNKEEELISLLNLNINYKVDHINILCLNNCNLIVNLLKKKFHFKNRVSIYCPFYIIHDIDKNRNSQEKIKDFFYSIFSDFLPLNYKYIYLSDLIRAIILNSELCQNKSSNSLEVLKFLDIMEIIGKI
ncbi:conserved Plasmodium protein, unknown function [Plasmodium gallinaceum]|uniref:Uncharacterized protein n=1 Tax=Plasmodium gallinaceum TaxID=5849 RepID=A0A1J1GNT7_PLAGA|nr:conserved Plasmodium protein, unknown function [Plasmodium gallinaceum]CRG94122.1 conserved Plasmodium protein, unknown function [Plasmodium gallinaceum]